MYGVKVIGKDIILFGGSKKNCGLYIKEHNLFNQVKVIKLW